MGKGKFALIFAVVVTLGVAAWPSDTHKSVVKGVTVAVTPGKLDVESGLWDFAVSFDAPGRRLDDEVMENIVLVGNGRRLKPLAWEGAAAGGDHRAGVLKFIAMHPRPKELVMVISRRGEAKPRLFRFVFGDWSA